MPVGHCWSFRAFLGSPWKSVGTMFVRPSGDFGVRSPKGLLPLCGSKIHLRFPVAREFYGWLIIATSTSGDARRVTTFERKRRQAARRVVSTAPPACGWLRGMSRTSPGPPSPVAEAGLVAEHFRSRARLRRLLAGLRPSTLHRSLRSLRQRGFAHYVRLRHYRSSLLASGK